MVVDTNRDSIVDSAEKRVIVMRLDWCELYSSYVGIQLSDIVWQLPTPMFPSTQTQTNPLQHPISTLLPPNPEKSHALVSYVYNSCVTLFNATPSTAMSPTPSKNLNGISTRLPFTPPNHPFTSSAPPGNSLLTTCP